MARINDSDETKHMPRFPRTPEREEAVLAAMRETGSITEAARVTGIPYRTINNWKRDVPEFAVLYQDALDEAIEKLESEAARRAYGYDEPVYQGGRLVGHVKRYSDTLLIFLLKGHKPEKYRERFSGELKAGGSLTISFTPEDEGSGGD